MLWALLVLLVVLLAVYVSVGRLLMANLNAYRDPLLTALNERLPFHVEAQQVNGIWRSFSPEIILDELRLNVPGAGQTPVQLAQGAVSINLLQSIRSRSLQLNHLVLRELALRGELTREGKLVIAGLDGGGGQSGDWLGQLLRNVERITLASNSLTLKLPGGETRALDLDLELLRSGSHRRLQGTLSSTAGIEILILANGVGDPLRPATLTGGAYLNMKTPNVEAMRALLGPGAPPFWANGSGEVALWLTLNEGEPTVEARLDAQDLVVYSDDGKLQLPLDRVSLQGQLQRQNDSWTLIGSDMEVRQGEALVKLPRVQVDVWGSAARVRLQDVPLEPVNTIATGLTIVPDSLREIFSTLSPRGTLPAVQINIGDINTPAEDWELDASFESLAVESFKGAPGVDAARGYAQLKPGGGSVTLDSRSLALAFPSIYHNPLYFDEVFGTLDLFWNKDVVALSSGLLTAFGEEGKARVLFGLDIPLHETQAGVEMELLVGLENTDTQFRDKYIPYTLSAGLKQWLADSIGAGTIEQGAFLWRGSLRKDGAALRTVQLAFNVADTQLNYHPQWPGVLVGAGQVLIDDAAVSVWSDDAQLYDSVVRNMSVELSVDQAGDLQLAIDGQLKGPASDGLRVINESALHKTIGKAFAHWQASGELEADLAVLLNISDKQVPPEVDVDTRWNNASLGIHPGNLRVESVAGDFSYSTSQGFSSDALSGKLWGEPIRLQLSQEHAVATRGYDPRTSVLNIQARSEVAMSRVQQWLSLDLLSMAQGKAAMAMELVIQSGEKPALTITSELEGVSLDMPLPYGKPASEKRSLAVSAPLGGDTLPVFVALGERLALELRIGGGALKAGSLGIAKRPLPLEVGVFRIAGSAPQIDGDAWLAFLGEHFSSGTALEADAPAEQRKDAGENAALIVRLEQLETDTLHVWGQTLSDVALTVSSQKGDWQISANSNWLRGSALVKGAPAATSIVLQHLDLDFLELSADGPLPEGAAVAMPRAEPITLPPLDFVIENLYRSGQRLGNLDFSLRSIGGVIKAGEIVGEIAGLRLDADAPGQFLWRQGEGGNTQVEGLIEFSDLGEPLDQFGYEQILKTDHGALDVQLKWPGNPQEFALAAAEGSILVDFGSGNFLEAPSGAAGALRVVNILNLADIIRRLSLTHMFESGIAFDSVTGEIYFHGGTIEVARMDVEGPSSFQFSGVSEVALRSLNGELVATLPVANNLPWVAALAASLPVAAGVFLVSKMFDKQVSRLSSAVYAIEGTWDEPVVEFDRLFDDTAKAVELPQAESEPGAEAVTLPASEAVEPAEP